MFNRKNVLALLSLLLVTAFVLSACQPQVQEVVRTVEVVTTEEVVRTVEVQTTVEVVTTVEVIKTVEPQPTTRRGGWLDEIIVSVVGADSAVTQLGAGAIDLYGTGLASSDLPAIEAAGLNKSVEIGGTYYELTYNVYGPVFDGTGKLNPFNSAKVREAMNWLLDRDFLNQEVYAGGGLPKFFSITTNYPDYANLADVARGLESKYAYNPELANEVISAEMEAMGATKTGDQWTFNGEPVTLIFLIRTDHDGTRRPVGDYVANQLESIGFTVDRQYKTSSEASPIWVGGNVADGLWHIYTGAWGATAIDRDMGDNFQFFSTPQSAYSFTTLWQAYACGEEFNTLADDLAFNRFSNLDERREAYARALEMDTTCGIRTWLIDGASYAPYNPNVVVTYDIAAGIGNGYLWPYTVRFEGQEGGRLKYGQPDNLVDPWNPIAGSNWSYDGAVQRATQSWGVVYDPHTGLTWPHRIERAEVTVEEGLPVGVTLDWLTLDFAPTIEVPADALVDWDAENQVFITAGEKFTETQTAQVKSVVYYPADLYETVKWHDGSPISVADFMMLMIMTFDPAKEGSAIYDEAQVANLESFLSVFKGFKIASTDPLVVEYYNDGFQLDAEINVTTLWPSYPYGEAPWHTIAIGNLAEAAGEIAYSADKADASEIEWTSFIAGPSLEVMANQLATAAAESYIPYAATLGQYITAEEAAARYANLQAWYDEQNHFWVGTGPYYLDQVFPTEDIVSLLHFADFPDLANRWDRFAAPKIAVVELDGPGQVTIGQEATFDVFVTFNEAPYAAAEISQVKYLLYDATGAVVEVGFATPVADGQYSVVLSAEATSALEAGANKVEVAVIPFTVAIPTFQSFEFVTAP
ncbi:MAG TPA: ABC transporter substrate-binding protein [Anaerolineales bacterium]|nr:ABC transporter substrate-binding protein [Anaerolineales bacterium]